VFSVPGSGGAGYPPGGDVCALLPLQDEDGLVTIRAGGVARFVVDGEERSPDDGGWVMRLTAARGVETSLLGQRVGFTLLDRGLAVVAGHGIILRLFWLRRQLPLRALPMETRSPAPDPLGTARPPHSRPRPEV